MVASIGVSVRMKSVSMATTHVPVALATLVLSTIP